MDNSIMFLGGKRCFHLVPYQKAETVEFLEMMLHDHLAGHPILLSEVATLQHAQILVGGQLLHYVSSEYLQN